MLPSRGLNVFGTMGARELSDVEISQAVDRASEMLKDVPLEDLNDSEVLTRRATEATQTVIQNLGLQAGPVSVARIANQVVARLGGMGFLHDYLPPQRTDLSEIAVTPDGKVWIQKKGDQDFLPVDIRPSHDDVQRSVMALLAPIRRAVDESSPSVDAKLPRMEGMGGARVKILHPCIVPGKGFHSINIRLFEEKPVTMEKLLEWNMAPEKVLRTLSEWIGTREARTIICGGTGTGKTTFQSALCNTGIPKNFRIIKIEDPEEIYLNLPHVVSIEARPAPPGSKIPSYTVTDGVNDAMRMTPKILIVGEIRRGDQAMAFFRAIMSDHPGLTTFHAESPEDAVYRMSVIMYTDVGVRMEAAKQIFALACDIFCQLGWHEGRRVLAGVWEVGRQLRNGDVTFNPLYVFGDAEMRPMTRR
ncbi:MAG: ATPase, T2SS/T4P/T4SS family [Anaerolineales bacterium]